MAEENDKLRELVAEVAAAYFSNSHVGVSDIPTVVNQIAASLAGIGAPAAEPQAAAEPERAKLTSAQVRRSVTPEALISFEDSKPYKTLRRHLATRGLSPAQYIEKWGLPSDYPMVAPSYSARRSELAKKLGLGQKGAQRRAAKPAAKPRGRKPASAS
ncbi:MAG: MucR family transcriptional regulator [Caulobacterales bacterium]|jgi:predicted transcriptional regulator